MNSQNAITVSRRDRITILVIVGTVVLAIILVTVVALHAADDGVVQLSVSQAAPRAVEEQTEKAILRDYAAAWQARNAALEAGNPSQLGDLWVGFARQDLTDAIAAQRQSGISVRFRDLGHRADAVFYSQEGSVIELHDTAQLERQVLDGATVVHSEQLTEHYIVLMTPTVDHWQVRELQAVPSF